MTLHLKIKKKYYFVKGAKFLSQYKAKIYLFFLFINKRLACIFTCVTLNSNPAQVIGFI